jgi:hypothetical protein
VNRAHSIQRHKGRLWPRWSVLGRPLAALALLGAGLWNLSGPPMWWDEGWTLAVARTWVEHGHYGRLLAGQLAPPGLEAAFTVTAPIALAFKLFGVGIWQGRLFGVGCLVGAVALMYLLALRLYDRRVAFGTLFVLLLMPMHPQLHALIMGRQVLAELPMLAYLLAGYVCLLAALDRSAWYLPVAAALWGMALVTKLQLLPFFLVSLLLPLGLALLARRWRTAIVLGVGLAGVLLAMRGFLLAWSLAIHDHTLPPTPLNGLYGMTALVLTTFNRLQALRMLLIAGLPLLFGLAYAAWRQLVRREGLALETGRDTLRLALLALAGSWFGWFVLLSVGVPRYMFPPVFVGSIFIAALLSELTGHWHLHATLERASGVLRRRLDRQVAGAWLALCWFALTVLITLVSLNSYYLNYDNRAAVELADYLNTQTPTSARVETYESEIHFLLNRPYHYPPDQLHIELGRRSLLKQQVTIDYDPLASDPDYLVVGRFARENRLYEPVIASGAFRLLREYEGYKLYERVR